MAKERAGALLILPDGIFVSQRRQIAELAVKRRLPSVYGMGEYAEAGGLMTYSASFLDMHRRAAAFVDKILKGAKPADLPVAQPTKFELVINVRTAKAIGLAIPPSLVQRADQIID
jgi:putative ABC transport system substrate-binding protein